MSDIITNTTNTNESKVFNVYVSKSTTAGTALVTRGSLNKTDPKPTVVGLYILEETGIYPNLGNIDAKAGKLNFASFDGTTWKLIAVDLPQPIVNNYITENTYNLDPNQIVPSEALYNDDTLAGDIIKRVDINTGENVNYRETTTWHDGSAMDDSKVDGVIFIKKSGKFYERTINGNISVKWFGAKGDGNSDDTTAINNALNFSNKFNKTLFFPSGIYVVTETLLFSTTQNVIFESIENTVIIRNHNGIGILAENTTSSYHYGSWKNINIISSDLFRNQGTGVNILRTSRFNIDGITITEFNDGIILDDVLVSNFTNVNLDRNSGKSLTMLRNSNDNIFNNLKILGLENTTGIELNGLNATGLYTNTFIGGQIEYCNIPVSTRESVGSIVFQNMYFESNKKGCILRNGTKYIYFNNCFIANKELISDEEFGAVGVYVYGLMDDYPIGAGNQGLNIKIGNNSIKYRNDIHVEDDDFYFSKNISTNNSFSLNGGTIGLQSGKGFKNLIHTIDSSHWSGENFTINGNLGNAPLIKFEGNRFTSVNVGFLLTDKKITTQMLAFGKGNVRIQIFDNKGLNSYTDFRINTNFPQTLSTVTNFLKSTSTELAVSVTIEGDISICCLTAHEGNTVNNLLHRGYFDSSAFNSFEVVNMYNVRVKSPTILSGDFINGDEIINDFSVDKNVYKWVMVDGSWKTVKFS